MSTLMSAHKQLQIEINFLKDRLFATEKNLIKLTEEAPKYSYGLTVGDYVEATEVERGEIRSIFTRKDGTEMALIESYGHLYPVLLAHLRKTMK